MHRLSWAISIALGAFLLFTVQPLLSKFILPWFGGGASIWIATLMFFQCVVFLGYTYAFLLSKIQSEKIQITIHGLFLLLTLFSIPITPQKVELFGESSAPLNLLLSTLVVSVLGPAIALSATSPLLQHWWRDSRGDAYKFYAVSNTASFVGLLSYPFIIERNFGLIDQTALWSTTYTIFVFLNLITLLLTLNEKREESEIQKNKRALCRGELITWFIYSFTGALLLLSMSRSVTTDIAPFPLLWIIPLGLYLLTFTIAFSVERFHRSRLIVSLSLISLLLWPLTEVEIIELPLSLELFIVLLSLFTFCLLLHGELSLNKPQRDKLTTFYLVIAFGGATAGVTVNIIAPLIFNSYIELFFGIALTVLLTKTILFPKKYTLQSATLYMLLIIAVLIAEDKNVIFSKRNFYGRVSVIEREVQGESFLRILKHGTTEHGAQFREEKNSELPISYYSEMSGIGKLFSYYGRGTSHVSSDNEPLSVVAIGLGAGAISAYMGENDKLHYIEINPAIVHVAENYFSYLLNSQLKEKITIGDGREVLQNALEENKLFNADILVLDAFSSDSIPTHLLTREAFSLYWKHLKENGSIAILYDSNYTDLLPVLKVHAERFKKKLFYVSSEEKPAQGIRKVRWAILTDENSNIDLGDELHLDTPKDSAQWSDDYTNISSLLIW